MIGNTRKKIKRINLPKFLLEILNNYNILSMNEIKSLIHHQLISQNYDISLSLLCNVLDDNRDNKYSIEDFIEKISLVYDLSEINLTNIRHILEEDIYLLTSKKTNSIHQKSLNSKVILL